MPPLSNTPSPGLSLLLVTSLLVTFLLLPVVCRADVDNDGIFFLESDCGTCSKSHIPSPARAVMAGGFPTAGDRRSNITLDCYYGQEVNYSSTGTIRGVHFSLYHETEPLVKQKYDSSVLPVPQQAAAIQKYGAPSWRMYDYIPPGPDYFSILYSTQDPQRRKEISYYGHRGMIYNRTVSIAVFGSGLDTGEAGLKAMMDEAEACAKNLSNPRLQKGTAATAAPPAATVAAVQGRLHGTIGATRYPFGVSFPLKHAKVTLLEAGKKIGETTTDAAGKYEFTSAFSPGKTYTIETELTYKTDREYFTIYTTDLSEGNKVSAEKKFTYTGSADLVQDFSIDDLWKEQSGTTITNPFGIMYVHMTEALEFYKNDMREDVHLNLPVKVVAFADDPRIEKDIARYDFAPGKSVILFSPDASIVESNYRGYREYHEFSHYMIANMYGKAPESVVQSSIPTVNHGGLVNPSTTDSWEEGLASFLAALIAEKNQLVTVMTDQDGEPILAEICKGGSVNGELDDNYDPEDYFGHGEELAVSGTLWDLYDSKAQYDDCRRKEAAYARQVGSSPQATENTRRAAPLMAGLIEKIDRDWPYQLETSNGYEDNSALSIAELWPVIRTYHADLFSFHEKLVQAYPAKKTAIDNVFLMHSFWKETTPGNGMYDNKEPFRDANSNGQYDAGEYYIDLAPQAGYNAGEVIGTAADAGRSSRRWTVQFPGHAIKVNNNAPYYKYTIEYPGTKKAPYTITTMNRNGYIYVQVPPDPDAKITVKAIGVTTGSPLVFTSQQFQDTYAASAKQGYYVSHDFRLQGAVPPQPQVPSFGRKGFDLLRAEGPAQAGLNRMAAGNMTGAIPLLVPLCAGIIALAVLFRRE